MLKNNQPEFIIIGVMKAGTTTLHSYLKQSNDLSMSTLKEPNYLTRDYNFLRSVAKKKQITEEETYLSLFEDKTKINGEASVSYFTYANHITFDPNQKIIVSLRDPVERAFSEYKMHFSHNTTKLNFSDCIRKNPMNIDEFRLPINLGRYANYLEGLFKNHPIENIKIIAFEDFVKNEEETVKDILEFIGAPDPDFQLEKKVLNESFYFKNPFALKFFNATRELRYPLKKIISRDFPGIKTCLKIEKYFKNKFNSKLKMKEEDRTFLQETYKEENIRLKFLLEKHGFDNSFVDNWQS